MADEHSTFSIHLSTAKSWRGGENQIWLLARGLQARGQRVLVVAPRGAPLLERCAAAGIQTRELSFSMFGVLKLAKLLRTERPTILHLHDGHAISFGRLASMSLITHRSSRNTQLVAHRRTVFQVSSARKFTGRIKRVIAISGAVREKLLAASVPDAGIRVVHSGLEFPAKMLPDNPAAVALRERCAIPAGSFIIAHAAALTAEKRQSDMLDAVKVLNDRLKARGATGVHLVIAGTGALEETLHKKSATSALGGAVSFAGFLNDTRPLWAIASAAFFASEAEGLCTALIEAQGAGLPAVVTRAGGMVEVVEDGVTGLSAEIGDSAEMAAALLRLHDDGVLRSRMSATAEQRARERFSADAMVEGVLSVYRELL